MGVIYHLIRAYNHYLLKRRVNKLSIERYGIKTKLSFVNVPLKFYLNEMHGKEFGDGEMVLATHFTTMRNNVIISHSIVMESFTYKILNEYPGAIERLIEHELAHTIVDPDGHGDIFKREFNKYSDGVELNDYMKKEYDIDISDANFWYGKGYFWV